MKNLEQAQFTEDKNKTLLKYVFSVLCNKLLKGNTLPVYRVIHV